MLAPPTRTARPLSAASGRHGLTFVELLLVLVLLGILVTLALPGFGTGARSHRVVRQAREVHAVLAQAERRRQRFRVEQDGRLHLEALNDIGTWEPVLTSLPADAPVTVVGGTGGAIVFEPDGRVQAPATVRVGAPPSRHEVRVLAGGLLRWEGPDP